MNSKVENDANERTDRNRAQSAGNNKQTEVGNNHFETISSNMTLMVGPNKLQQKVLGKFNEFYEKVRKKKRQ